VKSLIITSVRYKRNLLYCGANGATSYTEFTVLSDVHLKDVHAVATTIAATL